MAKKGGFYHDGRFADYRAVIDHYNTLETLDLSESESESESEKVQLEHFLRSI